MRVCCSNGCLGSVTTDFATHSSQKLFYSNVFHFISFCFERPAENLLGKSEYLTEGAKIYSKHGTSLITFLCGVSNPALYLFSYKALHLLLSRKTLFYSYSFFTVLSWWGPDSCAASLALCNKKKPQIFIPAYELFFPHLCGPSSRHLTASTSCGGLMPASAMRIFSGVLLRIGSPRKLKSKIPLGVSSTNISPSFEKRLEARSELGGQAEINILRGLESMLWSFQAFCLLPCRHHALPGRHTVCVSALFFIRSFGLCSIGGFQPVWLFLF